MSESRPFPPSPRRRALARQAGLSSASPLLVGGFACGAAILAAVAVAKRAAEALGATIADACNRPSFADPTHAAPAPTDASRFSDPMFADARGSVLDASASVTGIARVVIDVALPLLVAAAVVAIIAQLAQTRSLWFPRRRIEHAPALPRAAGTRFALDIVAAAVVGATAFGWLWLVAPRLALLVGERGLVAGVAASLAAFLATVAIAWVVIGVGDALVRHLQLASAMRMTAQEKREDDRLATADPRWAQRRRALAREPIAAPAIARSTLLLMGDDVAVAIAWDPTRQPIPLRTAVGRRAKATQLLALARRQQLPVHRDPVLAAALVDAEGAVPDAHWARLADIIAALRR